MKVVTFMNYKKIWIAADHAGLPLKKKLIESNPELPWEDLGTHDEQSVDYPDYTDLVVDRMKAHLDKSGQVPRDVIGVLICGSGQGMAIRANRFPFIRAALCWSAEIAKMSRAHNDANVLCLGSRYISLEHASEVLRIFLETPFEGGRHERRVTKLSQNC